MKEKVIVKSEKGKALNMTKSNPQKNFSRRWDCRRGKRKAIYAPCQRGEGHEVARGFFGNLYSGEGKEKRFTPLVKGERATKWRGDSMERIPQSFFGL